VTTGEAINHVEQLFCRRLSRHTVNSWLKQQGHDWPGLRRAGARWLWNCFACEYLAVLCVSRLGWQYENQNSETNN
jgi:hypothetical protein